MPVYRIPYRWEMCGKVEVLAASIESALDFARNDINNLSMEGGHYVDGSFDIDDEMALELAAYDEEGRREQSDAQGSDDPLEA